MITIANNIIDNIIKNAATTIVSMFKIPLRAF